MVNKRFKFFYNVGKRKKISFNNINFEKKKKIISARFLLFLINYVGKTEKNYINLKKMILKNSQVF